MKRCLIETSDEFRANALNSNSSRSEKEFNLLRFIKNTIDAKLHVIIDGKGKIFLEGNIYIYIFIYNVYEVGGVTLPLYSDQYVCT